MPFTTAAAATPFCRNFVSGRWFESRSGGTIEPEPANLQGVTRILPLSSRDELREARSAAPGHIVSRPTTKCHTEAKAV